MVGDSEPMQRTYALTRMVAAARHDGAGDRRERNRQGLDRAGDPPDQRAPEPAVRGGELLGDSGDAAGGGAFWLYKGIVHGAVQSRIGRIHAAHGGTLFLDEIGDMPLSLQSKILRFLEQGEVQRLGGNDNLKVDVRVIAATNADLKKRGRAAAVSRGSVSTVSRCFPSICRHCASGWATSRNWRVAFAAKYHPGRFVEPRGAAGVAAAQLAGKRARAAQCDRAGDDPGGQRRRNQARAHNFIESSACPFWAAGSQFGTHRACQIGKCCRVLMPFQ